MKHYPLDSQVFLVKRSVSLNHMCIFLLLISSWLHLLQDLFLCNKPYYHHKQTFQVFVLNDSLFCLFLYKMKLELLSFPTHLHLLFHLSKISRDFFELSCFLEMNKTQGSHTFSLRIPNFHLLFLYLQVQNLVELLCK